MTRFHVKRVVGIRVRKGKVGESVKAFIQNVHNFRDEALFDSGPPAEHVAIFDEAQRAWNLRQTASFMRRKKNRPGFSDSEPEFLISCMDRHTGLGRHRLSCRWRTGDPHRRSRNRGVACSREFEIPALADVYLIKTHGQRICSRQGFGSIRQRQNTHFDNCLHLAVSMRSFRAENVSAFVKALLDCEKQQARETFAQLTDRYPIAVTRDLSRAKQWIRSHARGTERFGLVASSKAQRLKPHAIDIRVDVDPVHWFLNDKEDTRSSYYLEDAATEFQVQGLELDWAV